MKLKLLLLCLLLPHLGFAYYVNHPCCSLLQPCGWWGSAEYILLWRKTRFFPPLVTTNPASGLPILSDPATKILFGDERIGGAPKSGARADFGIWISRCIGIGMGFFVVGEEEVKFAINGDANGQPILGRPFFNTVGGVQDAALISFPGSAVNGHIDIETSNRVWNYDLYLRYPFLGSQRFNFDLMAGFLFSQITDNFEINTTTTDVLLPPLTLLVQDKFSCDNQYIAALLGFCAQWRSCSWAVTVTGKVGLGNMQKTVEIFGNTITGIGGGGGATAASGGLLAQPSNIGTFKNTKFEAVSQIDANVQLKILPHILVTAGYTYIFWPSVALAGEQINLNINPTQVPGPTIGPPAPIFEENLTSFWVQGITAGLYFCY